MKVDNDMISLEWTTDDVVEAYKDEAEVKVDEGNNEEKPED